MSVQHGFPLYRFVRLLHRREAREARRGRGRERRGGEVLRHRLQMRPLRGLQGTPRHPHVLLRQGRHTIWKGNYLTPKLDNPKIDIRYII